MIFLYTLFCRLVLKETGGSNGLASKLRGIFRKKQNKTAATADDASDAKADVKEKTE